MCRAGYITSPLRRATSSPTIDATDGSTALHLEWCGTVQAGQESVVRRPGDDIPEALRAEASMGILRVPRDDQQQECRVTATVGRNWWGPGGRTPADGASKASGSSKGSLHGPAIGMSGRRPVSNHEVIDPATAMREEEPVRRPSLLRGDVAREGRSPQSRSSQADWLLADYLKLFYRRRWLIASVVVVSQVLALVLFASSDHGYEARIRLAAAPPVGGEAGAWPCELQLVDCVVATTRRASRSVIATLELWNHPDYSADHRWWLSRAASDLFRWPLFGGSRDASRMTGSRRDLAEEFAARLRLIPLPGNRLVDLAFVSSDPDTALAVANAAAREVAELASAPDTSGPETQDGALLEEVRAQRHLKEDYLRQVWDELSRPDSWGPGVESRALPQELATAAATLGQASVEWAARFADYRELLAWRPMAESRAPVPRLLLRSPVEKLLQRVEIAKPEAPATGQIVTPVTRVSRSELVSDLVREVESRLATAEEALRVAELARSSADAKFREQVGRFVLQGGGAALAVHRLDYLRTLRVVETLMERVSRASRSSHGRISVLAVASISSARRSFWSIARVSIPLSVVVGMVLALLLASLDDRVRTPDDLVNTLAVPLLGVVPYLGELDHQAREGFSAAAIEASRTIRTGVLATLPADVPNTVVVTSAWPGSGKTLIASSLAESLARINKRVLLVDSDLRKPRQHALYQVRNSPGLTNLLGVEGAASSAVSESVRKTSVPGLWLLPAGDHARSATDLLEKERWQALHKTLAEHFDWIILDTPPLYLADAAVVAKSADGVVLVVRADWESMASVRLAEEQLRLAGVTILGTVLNAAAFERDPWSYAPYYMPEISDYYNSDNRQ